MTIVKDIMDVTLDPSISALAKVITNQDGFNYLNKLKDSQGNYLLEKDPKNPN
ncbi:phage major capsid protein [Cetobacterium sp. 2A]|uniref:phage major capsid protein n=1 Tax=Cetobacterium sp. 2A TaxID=2754723 RepID=UPI00163BFBFA|nr:phage major capsid protein [Cetobacterium sp. 2A]MBC2855613.1 phage major capsid protein [Cetobacterium sp. 2A]